jgi:hypothetical protein
MLQIYHYVYHASIDGIRLTALLDRSRAGNSEPHKPMVESPEPKLVEKATVPRYRRIESASG